MEGLNITMVQDHFLPQEKIDEIEATEKKEAANIKLHEITRINEKWLNAPDWFTVKNLKLDGFICWIGEELVSISRAIEALKAGANGIIAGSTNSGKSHLAVAIARHIQQQGKKVSRLKDFDFSPLCDVNRYRESPRYKEVLERARDVDLLILDDYGKVQFHREGKLTYYGCIVFGIADSRAEERKQTILTSRYAPTSADKKELERILGDDFLRRIKRQESGVNECVTIIAK